MAIINTIEDSKTKITSSKTNLTSIYMKYDGDGVVATVQFDLNFNTYSNLFTKDYHYWLTKVHFVTTDQQQDPTGTSYQTLIIHMNPIFHPDTQNISNYSSYFPIKLYPYSTTSLISNPKDPCLPIYLGQPDLSDAVSILSAIFPTNTNNKHYYLELHFSGILL